MQFLSTLVFAGVASASLSQKTGQRSAIFALQGVMQRQIDYCKPIYPPYTCERSCGPGNVQCVSWPTCYNPSKGETCCSNGKYCPAGYYCTNAGCCPNDVPLHQCGATITLSVIPPPNTQEPSPSTSSPEPTTTYETTSSIETSSTISYETTSSVETSTISYETTSKTYSPTSAPTTVIPPVSTSYTLPSWSYSLNGTSSTSTPVSFPSSATSTTPVPTNGVGRNGQFDVMAALGGVVAFLI